MKKKYSKNIFIMILIAITTTSLTACGKTDADSGVNDSTQIAVNREDYTYIPEEFSLGDAGFVNAACGTEQGICFITSFFDDETFTVGEQGYCVDGNGICTKLPLRYEDTQGTDIAIDAIGVLSNGNLVYIKSETPIDANYNVTGPIKYYLVQAGLENCEEISCVDITEQLKVLNQLNAWVLKVDKEDHIYLTEGNRIWVFDIEGNQPFTVVYNGSFIGDMGVTKEGQVVFYGWEGQKCIYVIDETNGMLSVLKENIPNNASINSIIPSDVKGIWVTTIMDITEYDIETKTTTSVLNISDCGLSADSIIISTVLSDGNVMVISYEIADDGIPLCKGSLLRRTEKTSVTEEKEIITLGIFEDNFEFPEAVANFNKSQDTYKIEIINYVENNDYDAAITRFNNELIAGSGPDIIDLSKLNMDMLAGKGILEELTPYLEKDDELKRADLFESVLSAYSIDGKLYTIPNGFCVWGIAGSNEYIGSYSDGYSWTIEDIMNVVKQNPDKEMFGYGSKNYVLMFCLSNNLDKFVDWQSGECNFVNDEFIGMLEFSNNFKSKFDTSVQDYNPTDLIVGGTIIVEEALLSPHLPLQYWEILYGEDYVIKGFPSAEGTGLTIIGENMLAINAASDNKDIAWEFIKSLLTEEHYKNRDLLYYPTLISAYDSLNKEYITPVYTTDENGNQVEISKGGIDYVEYYAGTEEEIARLTDIINSCDRADTYDKQIWNIVEEEASAYFENYEGRKSPEEVAEIIQSRVKLYVGENR